MSLAYDGLHHLTTARAVPPPARAAGRTTAFVGYVAATLVAHELHERIVPEPDRPELLERYRRRFCTDMLRLFGVQWTINDAPPRTDGRGRLVVANHRSVLDIAVLVATFGGYVLSRADVAGWPLLGTLARRAKTVFVDRNDRRSGASAIRAIRRRLEEGGSVIVFPEGGTHRGDEVRRFRPGAFAAARGLDVEVVPVGLAYEPGTEYVDKPFATHLVEIAERRSTHLAGCVGEPIRARTTNGGNGGTLANADLAERAHVAVQQLVHEARSKLQAGSAPP